MCAGAAGADRVTTTASHRSASRGAKGAQAHRFLARDPRLVTVFDAEVSLEEIDHWQVARCLAIGHRTGLEDEPVLHAMRVGDFPDQARLAYASFPHYGDDLPTASCGTCERLAENLKLIL